MTIHIGIYVFPEVEALDFAGPYEVFTTASRVAVRRGAAAAPFEVFSVAHSAAPVSARAGLKLVPDHVFGEHPKVDVLVVPGGVVTDELGKPAVVRWVAETARSATLVASVCTGAFLLAQAGVLKGGRVTTHWEDIGDLAARFPALEVVSGPRWVDQGRLVTSAGISAGIDMCLHLVERLAGRALAEATARQMDYAWVRDDG